MSTPIGSDKSATDAPVIHNLADPSLDAPLAVRRSDVEQEDATTGSPSNAMEQFSTTPAQQLPPTIKVEEAGRILGISRTAAYRAAANGDLPTIRLNGRLYVPTARLLHLLGYVVQPPMTIAG